MISETSGISPYYGYAFALPMGSIFLLSSALPLYGLIIGTYTGNILATLVQSNVSEFLSTYGLFPLFHPRKSLMIIISISDKPLIIESLEFAVVSWSFSLVFCTAVFASVRKRWSVDVSPRMISSSSDIRRVLFICRNLLLVLCVCFCSATLFVSSIRSLYHQQSVSPLFLASFLPRFFPSSLLLSSLPHFSYPLVRLRWRFSDPEGGSGFLVLRLLERYFASCRRVSQRAFVLFSVIGALSRLFRLNSCHQKVFGKDKDVYDFSGGSQHRLGHPLEEQQQQ